MELSKTSGQSKSNIGPESTGAEYNYAAIILCGGKGTRLADVRGDLPKSLFKVNGKELIAYTLEQIDFNLVTEVVFALDYKAEEIKSWAYSANLPYDVKFSKQNNPGIPNAIKEALPLVQNDAVIVYNSDEIRLNFNLHRALRFHETYNSIATVIAAPAIDLYKHAVIGVNENNDVISVTSGTLYPQNQVGMVDTSLFILNKVIIPYLNFEETTSFKGITEPLVLSGKLKACIENDMLYLNINTKEDVVAAEKILRQIARNH